MLIISIFPLYNIVSDIIASVVVCVEFLGTHMASLVLLFKTGCDKLGFENSHGMGCVIKSVLSSNSSIMYFPFHGGVFQNIISYV